MNKEPLTKLTPRFESALVYACQLHGNQTRKISGVPYVSHLLSVAALVLEDGGDENQAIAALLHDAIEDQGGKPTALAIRQQFGDSVADLVEACTESDTIPKPPWLERKQHYIETFRHAPEHIRRVMLADKLHNARCNLTEWHRYGEQAWSFFSTGKEGLVWFYRSIVSASREIGHSFLADELERVVEKLEQL